MLEEYQQAYWTDFITLTYNEESLPFTLDELPQKELLVKHFGEYLDQPTLQTKHLTKFLKRLRKANLKYTSKQLRYYACGEYGTERGRPHYHLCVFNLHPKVKYKKLEKLWSHPKTKKSYGIVQAESANDPGSVMNYVASYVITAYQNDLLRINHRPFARMSLRPALGHSYVSRMASYHKDLQEPYLRRGKVTQRLPRYVKERIFEKYETNAWKQPNIEQHDLRISAEIHRQRLLNGPNYDAWDYEIKQRMYHEREIIRTAKRNDRY